MSTNQSIVKAFNIINIFTREEPEKSLTQISKETGINKTTVYRYLSSLMKIGLIGQDPNTGYYYLGIKLFEIGNKVIVNKNIIDISRPILTRVVNDVNITIHLATINDNEVVYLDKIKSKQSLQVHTYMGLRVPLHCTALGKSMLSFLPDDELQELLKKKRLSARTPKTITQKKKLFRNLKTARKNGYAVDREEFKEQVHCVAVPILNSDGYPIAALSMSGSKLQINNKSIPVIAGKLKRAAKQISEKF